MKTCEKCVHITKTNGELKHFENLKPMYFNTCKEAINLVLSDQVTHRYIAEPYVDTINIVNVITLRRLNTSHNCIVEILVIY